MTVYLFSIGIIDPIRNRKAANRAIKFIKTLPGFTAIHPDIEYTLLCFDTLDNAIRARARYTETGNQAGRYILRAKADKEKGLLKVEKPVYDSQGVS